MASPLRPTKNCSWADQPMGLNPKSPI